MLSRPLQLTALSIFTLIGSAIGCASTQDDSVQVSEAANTEAVCPAIRDTKPGAPQVYFAPFDTPEEQVLCALSTAKSEVVIAHYNIRRERVIEKLIELKKRGVDVKIAVDQANAAQPWNVGDDALEAAGIRVVRTKPAGAGAIMHLKVAVIDGAFAMTGSFNWNETAALANDENMLSFREPEIVSRYRNQALEVIGDKPREKQPAQATSWARVHFSPEEKTDSVIAREIDNAQKSVDIAMYTFTSATVTAAVEKAAKRGVRVRLVVEKKQTVTTNADETVERAGANVIRGANRVGQFSAMHQKYAIIDDARVIAGATNWTNSGTRTNEEDLLVLDVPELASKYRRNFADLAWIYGGLDLTGDASAVLARSEAPVLFNPIHGGTAFGDQVVVVGSETALGSWDPARGVRTSTHKDLFPSWTAATRLPAGARVEYKYVTIKANGSVEWEPGPNRVLVIGANGRAEVTSGTYGDTSRNWTPRTKP